MEVGFPSGRCVYLQRPGHSLDLWVEGQRSPSNSDQQCDWECALQMLQCSRGLAQDVREIAQLAVWLPLASLSRPGVAGMDSSNEWAAGAFSCCSWNNADQNWKLERKPLPPSSTYQSPLHAPTG